MNLYFATDVRERHQPTNLAQASRKTLCYLISETDWGFINKCLRWTVNIHWLDTIADKHLWSRCWKLRIWNWPGYTLRRNDDSIDKQALQWAAQGHNDDQRTPGKEKDTWTTDVKYSWRKTDVAASDVKFHEIFGVKYYMKYFVEYFWNIKKIHSIFSGSTLTPSSV